MSKYAFNHHFSGLKSLNIYIYITVLSGFIVFHVPRVVYNNIIEMLLSTRGWCDSKITVR